MSKPDHILGNYYATVLEGASFTTFYGQGQDSLGVQVVTQSTDDIEPHANVHARMVNGLLVHYVTVNVKTDSIFEGDENITVKVRFLTPSEGDGNSFYNEVLVYNLKVIDTTGKTMILDLDGDGSFAPLEVTAYNYLDAVRSVDSALRDNKRSIDTLEDLIDLYQSEYDEASKDLLASTLDLVGVETLTITAATEVIAGAVTKHGLQFVKDVVSLVQDGGKIITDPSVINYLKYGADIAQFAGKRVAIAADAFKTGLELGDATAHLANAEYMKYKLNKLIEERDNLVGQNTGFEEDLSQLTKIASQVEANGAPDQFYSIPFSSDVPLSFSIGETQVYDFRGTTTTGDPITVANDDVILGNDEGNIFDVGSSFTGATLDGGGGTDVVKVSLNRATFSTISDGSVFILSDGLNAVTLFDVERVEFSDGVLALDIDGISGQAYRLYKAAFDRAPDTEGLKYWVGELDAGKGDLTWVAKSFILSTEFQSTHGSQETVSDEAFLTLIYNNVLDRDPDGEGFQYWMDELGRGFERERILASFSESTENQANVIGVIEDGIWLG